MLRHVLIFMALFSCCELIQNSTQVCPNVKAGHSFVRKRRHLVFPEGSALAVTVAIAKAFLTHAPSGWMMTIEVDLVFDLPGAKFVSTHSRRKLHHRQKRELWDQIRGGIEIQNLNGRACVVRSVCEARTRLAPPGTSLIHDLLRAIFTAPLHEDDFTDEVEEIYRELLDPDVCERPHECPLSILDFILDFNNVRNKVSI